MNQELEQRVNELVLENNGMSHADALRQVQTELAEEEVKKKRFIGLKFRIFGWNIRIYR